MIFKSHFYRLCIFTLMIFSSTGSVAQSLLPIGSTLPLENRSMVEVSGRNLSLNDLAKENGLLVIFTCNTCPWVHRLQDRLIAVSEFANENDIGVAALNPNEGYRERGDDLGEMIKHADKAGYSFPYLLDKNHELADAFGATRTPEVFLFNANKELIYKGSIDDNPNSANSVQDSYLRNAMEAMLIGSSIQTTTSRLVGCTIKRAG